MSSRATGSVEVSDETLGPASTQPHRFVESADLALAALTPVVAGLSLLGADHQAWPIVLWLGGLFVARRFGIQPLVRLAQRTTRQRDLVVSATERERARIAADIHDYALQDLTMLVRRLDAAGDVENAAATREVAERLRAICGDLRLPVLDDLGVGPALEWLCGRVEQGGQRVSLDRLEDEKRLPAEAELAFFRVAQEAINNAVRHGAPPVWVRYRGGGSWAELEVDDCGTGVPAGAAEAAERTGHLGLMSMSQRAEAIGADLSIGRRPGGGTRVRLVWEGAAEPASPAHGDGDGDGGRVDDRGGPTCRRPGGRSRSRAGMTGDLERATPIRVAIVDDHPVVREGTAALLGAVEGLTIAGTAGSLAEAEPLLDPEAVDVVLLDIRLGTTSGLTLLGGGGGGGGGGPARGSRVERPLPAIVVLTAYDYPQYVAAAMRLGASGFVLKTAPIADLVDAIRRVAAGGLAFGIRPTGRPPTFTARELDVVRLVVEGCSNEEIGTALGITAKTVEAHLRRLFERLGLVSRTELATRALREGWLEVPPAS